MDRWKVSRRRAPAACGAIAITLLVGAASPAAAGPLFSLPSGQDVTLAGAGSPRSVQIAAGNPAAPVTSDLGAFWFGLGGTGVTYEVGDLDDLVDDAEEVSGFLTRLNDTAYVKVAASAQPPFLPMGGSLSGLGGAFTLSATAITGARIAFLGDYVNAVNDDGTNTDCNTSDCTVDTNLSGYGKAAAGAVVSLGYSGGVHHRDDGSLFVGGRVNYYAIELSRGVIPLADDDQSGDGEDDVQDEFDRNRKRTNAIGVDLGALWAAHNFRAGATLRNINEPEFEYPAIGVACESKPAGAAQDNCNAAAAFAVSDPTRVRAREIYTMERQMQLETAAYTANRTWSLGASYDLDAAKDAVGDEYQWLSVSGAFTPRGLGWFVPGIRAGYRRNQVGSELEMVSLGLSLFRVVNLDVAASTQSVENDGDEIPRSAMASLSLELFF